MAVRAHCRLVDAMGLLCERVLGELFTPAELSVLTRQLAVRPYGTLTLRGPENARSVDDTITSLGGASMGFMLSRLVTMLPAAVLPAAFGVVLMPVSMVLGGATAWYMVRSRRRVCDKQHLKQWLNEMLGEAKAHVDQDVAAQFVEADQQMTLAPDDALARQVVGLDEQIKEVDGPLRLDTAERATRLKAVDDGGRADYRHSRSRHRRRQDLRRRRRDRRHRPQRHGRRRGGPRETRHRHGFHRRRRRRPACAGQAGLSRLSRPPARQAVPRWSAGVQRFAGTTGGVAVVGQPRRSAGPGRRQPPRPDARVTRPATRRAHPAGPPGRAT